MKGEVIIKRVIFIIVILVITIVLIRIGRVIPMNSVSNNLTEVSEGTFEITVTAAGELSAENSYDIKGPELIVRNIRNSRGRSRNIRASDVKIIDIVPEGTMVNNGDFVAQLDRTTYENTLKDEQDRLKTMQSDYELKVLDTAVTMTGLRDDIKNQMLNVEEAAINLEQSAFEPPATMRKARMALDKEKRSLEQKKQAYKLRQSQQVRNINNLKLDISMETRLIEDLGNYLAGFTVKSPAAGMIVYKRNWNGTKRVAGSTLSPFDMVVATLPDLSTMISKTYISEIDVNKVRPGQKVKVKIDAFKDKMFSGTVIDVAKIGEQLPNSDTKMFEVAIRINEKDLALRPSMTTNNEIIIKTIDNAVYVPLESVRADTKGFTYVYTRYKTRQVVIAGEANDKNIIINKGLEPGTEVYLSSPEDASKFRLEGEDLIDKNAGQEKMDVSE